MKKDKDSLGNRMKTYERSSTFYLTNRMPIIIRLDGCHFHTYTKGFSKPFDQSLQGAMTAAAHVLVNSIQGAELAYIQSDEISLLINCYKKFNSEPWFDNNVQKMCSVSASMAATAFNDNIRSFNPSLSIGKVAIFDSRVFNVPREDVRNCFIWRQKDAIRNSVSSLAQANFSHKQLQGKKSKEMKEMLLKDKGIDWNLDLLRNQRGWCVTKQDGIVWDIPLFTEEAEFINKHLAQEEE